MACLPKQLKKVSKDYFEHRYSTPLYPFVDQYMKEKRVLLYSFNVIRQTFFFRLIHVLDGGAFLQNLHVMNISSPVRFTWKYT